MSKVIIVLVIFLLLAVGGGVLYLKIQPSTKPSVTPPQPSVTPPPPSVTPPPPSVTPPPSNQPKNAVCSIENAFTTEGITEENKDDNYTFDLMKLGRDLKDNIEKFTFLSTPVYDINQLNNDTTYYTGNLKPESQIRTLTPPLNGGKNCLSFPQTVYLPAPSQTSSQTSSINYQKFPNKDVGGNDIKCYFDGSPAVRCQNECSSNPNCKATNYIYPNGVWGAGSGCCLKTVDGPMRDQNGIDFYVKSQVSSTKTVQYVRIKRITTAPDGTNAINISEIQAFDINGRLITPESAYYDDNGIGFPAINAIDGNLNNFAHTSDHGNGPLIEVAYTNLNQVKKIVISNRVDCCQNRMIGTSLMLFSKPGSTPDVANIPITDTRGTYTFTFNGTSWVLS